MDFQSYTDQLLHIPIRTPRRFRFLCIYTCIRLASSEHSSWVKNRNTSPYKKSHRVYAGSDFTAYILRLPFVYRIRGLSISRLNVIKTTLAV